MLRARRATPAAAPEQSSEPRQANDATFVQTPIPPPPRTSAWLVSAAVIAGAAIGLVGQLLWRSNLPEPRGEHFTGLDPFQYLQHLGGDILQLPLLIGGAVLCVAALVMALPPSVFAALTRINLRLVIHTLLLFGASGVATHAPIGADLVIPALIGVLIAGLTFAPSGPLMPLAAASSVLTGHIVAGGWQSDTPIVALALAGTATLLGIGSLRNRVKQVTPVAAVTPLNSTAPPTRTAGEGVSPAVLAAADGFIAAMSPGDIADRIAEDTNTHLNAAGTILLVWDENLDSFRVGAIGGRHALSGAELRQVEVPPDCVPHLRATTAGQVLEVDPSTVREPMLCSLLRRWKAGTLLGVRLQWGERMLGLLFVARTPHAPPFDARDRQVLTGIARHAAAGLAHVNLIADLQSANQLKEEFMATMSHELRTPLNVIIGYTDLQMDGAFGDLNPEHLDTLGRVRDQALQLLELIQATLDTSRLERGLVTVDLTDVTVPSLIESLKAQIPPSWRKPTVELNWRVPNGLPTIRTDPSKLQIILRNLIHNALKFTHHGLVTLAVLRHPNNDRISFVVQDSGVGIKAEHLSQIFDMFRQAPNGGGGQNGVGLGLYIVKRLAGILGAEIDVSSAPDRGATFRIHVPIGGPVSIPTRP
jgi:signal transduction histidine kinase